MTTTHGYFTDKARTVFATAQGDPDLSHRLASWAEAAHACGDSRVGVVVTEDGRLLATTRYIPGTVSAPGATYVTDVFDARYEEAVDRELGLALGSLRRINRELGQHHGAWDPAMNVIHVKYSQVCQGAGRPA